MRRWALSDACTSARERYGWKEDSPRLHRPWREELPDGIPDVLYFSLLVGHDNEPVRMFEPKKATGRG